MFSGGSVSPTTLYEVCSEREPRRPHKRQKSMSERVRCCVTVWMRWGMETEREAESVLDQRDKRGSTEKTTGLCVQKGGKTQEAEKIGEGNSTALHVVYLSAIFMVQVICCKPLFERFKNMKFSSLYSAIDVTFLQNVKNTLDLCTNLAKPIAKILLLIPHPRVVHLQNTN